MADGTMTPADISAVVNRGYNDGMFGGDWFWIIILLFFMGGNGFGYGYGNNGWENEFLQRDIFSTNQNVSTTGAGINQNISDTKYDLGMATLENRYTSQLATANSNALMQNCCCQTQRDILENRYDNALQTQTLSSQIASESCDTRANSTANTQKILDKLCAMEIDNLQNRLNEKEAEIRELQLMNSQTNLANGIINNLRPAPVPAYITASPYQSLYTPYGYGNGCGCNYANTLV